jgi:hypothetical protein
MQLESLKPTYTASRALVIGIDKYVHASPLGYAVSDAVAIADLLVNKFSFRQGDVQLLRDEQATKANIVDAYLDFADSAGAINDRILVFFAGHGHTRRSGRGEVGYLVPHDGTISQLSSLIRWDDLTRNADLIPAKHVLFIMDACYGGLALSRSGLMPGSMRFLRDMLMRPVRQVLTAGKADETVADSGGPLPEHSVFTGHLIEALNGKAASTDGVITANGVMSYVYEKVARDHHSRQTPHYGFLDGDGDFIFAAKMLQNQAKDEKTDEDELVSVPTAPGVPVANKSELDVVRESLSDSRLRIKLDEVVSQNVRSLIGVLSGDEFGTNTVPDTLAVVARIQKYDTIADAAIKITTTLAHWGEEEHQTILRKSVVRLVDHIGVRAGHQAWIGLLWYPLDLIITAGSLGALAANKYRNLATLLLSPVRRPNASPEIVPLVVALEGGMLDAYRTNVFKVIPGHEKNFVPKSEYQYKVLQPTLDDLLFLGQDYEDLFDRAEIFKCLVHAHWRLANKQYVWGPPGRFVWKFRRDGHPFAQLVAEAAKLGPEWPPLKAGFFNGSREEFSKIAEDVRKEFAARPWI